MVDKAKAFEEGKQAAIAGTDAGANPYSPSSEEHAAWREGFAFVEKFDEDGEVPSDP